MKKMTRAADVAAKLEKRIRDGEFPPKSKLPRIAELAEEYNAAENTVSSAMKTLSNLGLVRKGPSGVAFVDDWRRPFQLRRNIAVYRDAGGYYFDEVARTWVGTTPASRISWGPVEDRVADILGIEYESEVLIRERTSGEEVDLGPGKTHVIPMQVCSTTVPADIAREHDLGRKDTGVGGVLDRLEEVYGPFDWEVFHYSRNATKEEAAQLNISADTPVTGRIVAAVAPSGRVVAVNNIRFAGRFMDGYKIKRTASAK